MNKHPDIDGLPHPQTPPPREALNAIPAVPHGGMRAVLPPGVLDFSSNVNPYGPSPLVWEAMRAVALDQHPDPRAAPLRRLLAEREGLPPAMVLAGNGSVDLLYQLAVAYLRPDDRVLVVGPTFGEYAAAAAVMGALPVHWRARPEHGLELDLDGLLRAVGVQRPRMLFLCNPNNPTGGYLPRAAVERLLRAAPETLLVLDEAFVGFLPDAWSSRPLLEAGNLAVLRSLTKDYALTGLRAGYLLGPPALIAAVEKVQPPWSVNALAQAAARVALADEGHLRRSLAALAEARAALVDGLERLGLAPLPSRLHFSLLEVGDGAAWQRALLERGILVRDCASFGLPAHIRIASRRPEENARLLEAVREVRSKK
ncbi:MAG TPA: histidinol-phosphate transaminase [Roseiflexaceae bacterium]|nr:histidinol-phosphate transaminase [Roseiflexaceae bacterium]